MKYALIWLIVLVLVAIGFFIYARLRWWRYFIQPKRCTAQTEGTVIRYSHFVTNGGYCPPIVEYTVNGIPYQVRGPEYAAYVTKTRSAPWLKNHMTKPITDDMKQAQVFHMDYDTNSAVSLKAPALDMYPPGAKLPVFYDPDSPKLAYVLRYCNLKWVFYLLTIAGIALVIAGASIAGYFYSNTHFKTAGGAAITVDADMAHNLHIKKTGDSTFIIRTSYDSIGSGQLMTEDECRQAVANKMQEGYQVYPSADFTIYSGTLCKLDNNHYLWYGQSGNTYVYIEAKDLDLIYCSINGRAIGSSENRWIH